MNKKVNVSASIKALEVGENVNFDLARYDYVVACRTRLQMTTGNKYTSRIDREKDKVNIKRIF